MIWNPDCKGPCDCPGEERADPPKVRPLPPGHTRPSQGWAKTEESAREVLETLMAPRAKVILFKPGGKYYTEENWRIPSTEEVVAGGGRTGDAIGPYCMRFSPDFRRISGGPVLVDTQEPWGYPHLIPVDELNPACPEHVLVQHRDRKPKWCNTCGRAANGELIGKPKAA